MEFMLDKEILGKDEKDEYYLVHDEDTQISHTSSKIYSKLYYYKSDSNTLYSTPPVDTQLAYQFSPLTPWAPSKTPVSIFNSMMEYSSDDGDTDELYDVASFTTDEVYKITCVDDEVKCTCKAFMYNTDDYCKHITKLTSLMEHDVGLQNKYPGFSTQLLGNTPSCVESVHSCVESVPVVKLLDTFYYTNSGGIKYNIDIYDKHMTCTCPDFTYRGPLHMCKHMKSFKNASPPGVPNFTTIYSSFSTTCKC
jgi:hypothetical protein